MNRCLQKVITVTATVVIADGHIGSVVALCPEDATQDNGTVYTPTRLQRKINEDWKNHLAYLGEVKKKTDIVGICLGDMVEGDTKDRTFQIIARLPTNIIDNASKVLDPFVSLCSKVYWISGTDAHVGKDGSLEDQLAKNFESVSVFDEEGGYPTWDSLHVTIDGWRFDLAHQGPNIYGLPWTRKNKIIAYAAKMLFGYFERNVEIPHFVVRAHCHGWADSEHAFEQLRAVNVPGWTAPTRYIRKKDSLALADIGSWIVFTDKHGHITDRKWKGKPWRVTYQRIKP